MSTRSERFGGEIRRTFAASTPDWPARPAPPDGAPDVVVVLVDDLGFSDLGCYGSEIATPHLDALAARGLRWSGFHATPMCSPTRASLLTGLNPHAAGFGVVANTDPGYPGYAMELPDDTNTLAEVFSANGYATAAIGKWHLSKEADNHDGGDRHSWPLQRGFDRFYGFLEGFTTFHHPHRLVEGNDTVTVDQYPDGYYLTDDLTDKAISYVRSLDANAPGKPLFMYFAHAAVHAPLQAKRSDIEAQRGNYDVGWDVVRARRFERQRELGVIPANALLPDTEPTPELAVRPWAELDDNERRFAATSMEVYAAMVANIDANLGRLLAAFDELGRLDNTIVIFLSDNGASREGEHGTVDYLRATVAAQLGQPESTPVLNDEQLAELGGPTTLMHYPRGWAFASSTPWRMFKQHTYAGGHTVPFIVAGPGIPATDGGATRFQYQHVTDILPTLAELIGLEVPSERRGVTVRAGHGASFAGALRDESAVSSHPAQHYAMLGHRGFYRDGWEVVTNHRPLTPFDDAEWSLFDVVDDPTQRVDLAAQHPQIVRDLADRWEAAAVANDVYPLDEGAGVLFISRPPTDAVYQQPVRLFPGTPTLERWRASQLVQLRSFDVDIEVVPDADGAAGDGVLVAHGGQGGGYVVYLEDGRLQLAYNEYNALSVIDGGTLPSGSTRIGMRVTAGERARCRVELLVGDDVVGSIDDAAALFGLAPLEGIDVGVDRRSPVSWPLWERHGSFPTTAIIRSVTYTPGPEAADSPMAMLPMLRQLGAAYG